MVTTNSYSLEVEIHPGHPVDQQFLKGVAQIVSMQEVFSPLFREREIRRRLTELAEAHNLEVAPDIWENPDSPTRFVVGAGSSHLWISACGSKDILGRFAIIRFTNVYA